MSENGKERNYGETVDKETYEWGLRLHPYIPQADQGIVDEIEIFGKEKQKTVRVLDLGCGPGRLTSRFAALPHVEVIGLDSSPEFIDAARKAEVPENVEFVLSDFVSYEPGMQFDVIVMQGVFHHIHGKERVRWLEKLHSILAPGGVLIVGDEFIPSYESEEERRARAGLGYLHIIGEALKGRAKKGEMDLAKEECINFIADVLSGEEVCGYYDDVTIDYIKREAADINNKLFVLDGDKGKRRMDGATAARRVNEIIGWVRNRATMLKESGVPQRIDRGDYKISIEALENELSPTFTEDKKRERKFGPVDEILGMGVLVFRKT